MGIGRPTKASRVLERIEGVEPEPYTTLCPSANGSASETLGLHGSEFKSWGFRVQSFGLKELTWRQGIADMMAEDMAGNTGVPRTRKIILQRP